MLDKQYEMYTRRMVNPKLWEPDHHEFTYRHAYRGAWVKDHGDKEDVAGETVVTLFRAWPPGSEDLYRAKFRWDEPSSLCAPSFGAYTRTCAFHQSTLHSKKKKGSTTDQFSDQDAEDKAGDGHRHFVDVEDADVFRVVWEGLTPLERLAAADDKPELAGHYGVSDKGLEDYRYYTSATTRFNRRQAVRKKIKKILLAQSDPTYPV